MPLSLMVKVFRSGSNEMLIFKSGSSFNKSAFVKDSKRKRSAASEAFEINSHYHKYAKKMIKDCIKSGTLISLGSNAHSIKELGQIQKLLKKNEKN